MQCQYHGYNTHSQISFILDRNLAKANCTENHVCTSCDKVVLAKTSKAASASLAHWRQQFVTYQHVEIIRQIMKHVILMKYFFRTKSIDSQLYMTISYNI